MPGRNHRLTSESLSAMNALMPAINTVSSVQSIVSGLASGLLDWRCGGRDPDHHQYANPSPERLTPIKTTFPLYDAIAHPWWSQSRFWRCSGLLVQALIA